MLGPLFKEPQDSILIPAVTYQHTWREIWGKVGMPCFLSTAHPNDTVSFFLSYSGSMKAGLQNAVPKKGTSPSSDNFIFQQFQSFRSAHHE